MHLGLLPMIKSFASGDGRLLSFTYLATCDPIMAEPRGKLAENGLQIIMSQQFF